MFASLILTIPLVVAPLLQNPPTRDCNFDRRGDPAADARAVASFSDAVEKYADLHRLLDRNLPPDWMMSDREQADFAAAELAALLRDARPGARLGDFFKPEVAAAFRFRIDAVLREHGYEVAALDIGDDEDGGIVGFHLRVNEALPWGVAWAAWPAVVKALPTLPLELEYRFVGHDLVLLDVQANLIVDILELAVPTAAPRTDSHLGRH